MKTDFIYQSLGLSLNGKLILFAFILALEVIVGASLSLSPEYTAIIVCGFAFVVGVILIEPRLTLYLIFFIYPLSYFELFKIGTSAVRLTHFVVPALIIAIFLRTVANKKFGFQRSYLDIPIIMFALWIILSIAWSPSKSHAVLVILKTMFAVTTYFVTVNFIKSRYDLHMCLKAYFIVIIILLAVGLLQMMGLEQIGSIEHRRYTTQYGSLTVRPSAYAFQLVNAIWASLALATMVKGRYRKVLIYSALPLMITALAFTAIRTAYAAFLVTMAIFFLSIFRLRYSFFYVLGGVVAVIVVFVLFSFEIFSSKNIVFYLSSTFDPKDLSMMFRYVVWGASYGMLIDNFFFGVGVGGYESQFINYFTPIPGFSSIPELFPNGAPIPHSLYFDISTELGVIGFLIFLFIMFIAFKKIISTFYQLKGTPDANLLMYIVLILTNIFVSGIAGVEKGSYDLWINLGLSTAVCSILGSKRQSV